MAYVAANAVSGMDIQLLSEGGVPNDSCVRLLVYGTYTAADFYMTPNAMLNSSTFAEEVPGCVFKPSKVRIYNTTDATISEWYLDGLANLTNSGFTQVAAGDKTAVAKGSAGVTWDAGKLYFDVSACLITDNDEVIIELYR